MATKMSKAEKNDLAEGAVAYELLPAAKAEMDHLTQAARAASEARSRCSNCGHREPDKDSKQAVRRFRVTFGQIGTRAMSFKAAALRAAADADGRTPEQLEATASGQAAVLRNDLRPLAEWLEEQEKFLESVKDEADPAEIEEARAKYKEQTEEAKRLQVELREAVEREGMARMAGKRALEAALKQHLPSKNEQKRIQEALWPERGEQVEAKAGGEQEQEE